MNRIRVKNRMVLLDISSDIVVLGSILAVILGSVKRGLGPDECKILLSFLVAASAWKIISPFSETRTSWSRYISAVLLLLLAIAIAGLLSLI